MPLRTDETFPAEVLTRFLILPAASRHSSHSHGRHHPGSILQNPGKARTSTRVAVQLCKMSEHDVEPKAGDLIEVSRLGYQHWAIYVGSGYVVHLGPSDALKEGGTSSIMSVTSQKAVVKKELLWDIVGDDFCRVNNKYDKKYPPFPASKIVREAESLVGKEMAYSLTRRNCEHFVTRLRYGKARSDQVRDALMGSTLIAVGTVAAVATAITTVLLPKHRKEK